MTAHLPMFSTHVILSINWVEVGRTHKSNNILFNGELFRQSVSDIAGDVLSTCLNFRENQIYTDES